MILKIIYTVFIGILLATFVGVGIAAFYPGPTAPEAPVSVKYPRPNETLTSTESAQILQEQETYDKAFKVYQQEQKNYNRNVSIISLVAAFIILTVSLTLVREIQLITDGLLLGGVLSLGYSIIMGFNTGDDKFRFVVVTVGLVVSLLLGYLKFIRPEK